MNIQPVFIFDCHNVYIFVSLLYPPLNLFRSVWIKQQKHQYIPAIEVSIEMKKKSSLCSCRRRTMCRKRKEWSVIRVVQRKKIEKESEKANERKWKTNKWSRYKYRIKHSLMQKTFVRVNVRARDFIVITLYNNWCSFAVVAHSTPILSHLLE